MDWDLSLFSGRVPTDSDSIESRISYFKSKYKYLVFEKKVISREFENQFLAFKKS
jgi:hypothetical protein